MKKILSFTTLAIALIFVTAACTPTNSNENSNTNSTNNTNTESETNPVEQTSIIEETPSETTASTESPDQTETTSDNPQDSPGLYTDYDESLLANAENGKVVLFFHAAWCPTCIALDNNIKNSADDIQSNLTILKVDYDSATELKKKYGVTYQHTMVQVDANGEQIAKWSGGNTLGSIETKVQ